MDRKEYRLLYKIFKPAHTLFYKHLDFWVFNEGGRLLTITWRKRDTFRIFLGFVAISFYYMKFFEEIRVWFTKE